MVWSGGRDLPLYSLHMHTQSHLPAHGLPPFPPRPSHIHLLHPPSTCWHNFCSPACAWLYPPPFHTYLLHPPGAWHNSGIGIVTSMVHDKCWRLARGMLYGMAFYYGLAATTWVLGGARLFVSLFLMPFMANVGLGSIINFAW